MIKAILAVAIYFAFLTYMGIFFLRLIKLDKKYGKRTKDERNSWVGQSSK